MTPLAPSRPSRTPAPTAQRTAKRLKRTWPETLRLALERSPHSRDLAVGFVKHTPRRPHLDEGDVVAALRTVALRLGGGKPNLA